MTQYLLSILIWLPIAGGFLTLLLGDGSRNLARWLALGIAVATFAFSIPLYLGFDGSTAACQFIERTAQLVRRSLEIDAESRQQIGAAAF